MIVDSFSRHVADCTCTRYVGFTRGPDGSAVTRLKHGAYSLVEIRGRAGEVADLIRRSMMEEGLWRDPFAATVQAAAIVLVRLERAHATLAEVDDRLADQGPLASYLGSADADPLPRLREDARKWANTAPGLPGGSGVDPCFAGADLARHGCWWCGARVGGVTCARRTFGAGVRHARWRGWWRVRAGLLQACDDAQLFGVPLTTDQRRRLRSVEAARMHVWAVGRRGLKTTSAAYVGVWCCLLRPELLARLRPGERGYAVGVATNLRQARLLVQAARVVVERSPLLAPLVESVSEDEIVFANGTAFAAFPCTSRGGRGWPVFCLLLDELAHFVDNEGNLSAEAVVRALLPATAQFGGDARVIAASTPWGSEGLFAEMFAKAENGQLQDAVAHHATTAEANPSIDAAFLAAEERRDPETFRSEYLAQFIGSGGAFFDSDAVAGSATLAGELDPADADDWVAGLDPAFSSDPFGLVLVGRDRQDRRRLLVGCCVSDWFVRPGRDDRGVAA